MESKKNKQCACACKQSDCQVNTCVCETDSSVSACCKDHEFEINKDLEKQQEQTVLHDEQNNENQLKEQLIRLAADFQNYKRRVEKEQLQWIFSFQSRLLQDFLLVLDDLDRSILALQTLIDKTVDESNVILKNNEHLMSGLLLTQKRLVDLLKKNGVTTILETKIFNPELHEALMHIDSSNHAEGDIVQVLQPGYMFQEKVLRPAKVSVAK